MNLLECKICGYTSNQLFQHLKFKHGVSKEEYRNIFGQNCVMQTGFKPPHHKNINAKHSTIVKNTYIKSKKLLDSIKEVYSKEETKNILIKDDYYKSFIGRTKQRTLLKQDPKLYKSVYYYSDYIKKHFNKKINLTLPIRLKFIVKFDYDVVKLECGCGNFTINNMCKACTNKYRYPSKEYFKRMYKFDWEKEYEKDSEHRKKMSKGLMSLEWFKKRYGNNGYNIYKNHYDRIFNNKKLPYSKISQRLFWNLYGSINDKNDCYFAELNNEYKVFLNKNERNTVNKHVIYLDFKYRNKIIEFDGLYWHKNKENDTLRDGILNTRGFKILRISDIDYNNDPQTTINRCINFIKL